MTETVQMRNSNGDTVDTDKGTVIMIQTVQMKEQ